METSALKYWPIQDKYAPPIEFMKVDTPSFEYNGEQFPVVSKRVICFNHWLKELQDKKVKKVAYYSMQGILVDIPITEDETDTNGIPSVMGSFQHVMHMVRYRILEYYE